MVIHCMGDIVLNGVSSVNVMDVSVICCHSD